MVANLTLLGKALNIKVFVIVSDNGRGASRTPTNISDGELCNNSY